MKKIQLEITDNVYKELEYMVALKKKDDDDFGPTVENVEDIILELVNAATEGSMRPGSWERQIIQSTGLVSNQPEQKYYRREHGQPPSWDIGYLDGLDNHDKHCQIAPDGLAYSSGWIEGEAYRLKQDAKKNTIQGPAGG